MGGVGRNEGKVQDVCACAINNYNISRKARDGEEMRAHP